MSEEIKDFIHLYLGCDVQTPDCIGKNLGHYYSTEINEFNGVNVTYPENKVYVQNYVQVKLILRPLSDLTEEERLYCGIASNMSAEHYKDDEVFSFEQVRYLLSKHIDLFGLIEKGLVITKTTNNENG